MAVELRDGVRHPAHYTAGRIECIEAQLSMLCGYQSAREGKLAADVMKYLWRAPLKGEKVKDYEKALYYLERLIREAKEGKE